MAAFDLEEKEVSGWLWTAPVSKGRWRIASFVKSQRSKGVFGEARGLVVTYSIQFRSLSSSAGIGSHRGAVQPLHRGGSDCRGSQRDDFRAAYFKG